jgi:hypothetical protein
MLCEWLWWQVQVMLLGSAISVGRPASYVDPNKAQLAASQAAAALAAFRAGDTSALVTAGVQPAPGLPAPLATMAVPSPAALPPLPAGVPGPGGMQLPGAPIEGVAPPPPRPPPGSPPPGLGKPVEVTPYLCVSGMVTAETLSDDREYQEVGTLLDEHGIARTLWLAQGRLDGRKGVVEVAAPLWLAQDCKTVCVVQQHLSA